MALEDQNGAELGVPFMHATDGDTQVPVVVAAPGALEFQKGATPGVPFLFALDTETGMQLPVVALHPEGQGGGGGGGSPGAKGDKGWSPVLAIRVRGDDSVLQVIGWVGGSGESPAINQYIGESGLTNDINQAMNIRGAPGEGGGSGGAAPIRYSLYFSDLKDGDAVMNVVTLPESCVIAAEDFHIHSATPATSIDSFIEVQINGEPLGRLYSDGRVDLGGTASQFDRISFVKPSPADATWAGVSIAVSHTQI